MKTCSSGLQAHLSGGQTALAWCWKIKRVDGTILGFTTLDQELPFDLGDGDGLVDYEASTGYANTANQFKSDLSVDNSESTGFLESGSITEADIRACKYDGATLTVFIVNWSNLSQGALIIRTGYFGIVKMKNGLFTVECRGLASKLSTNISHQFGAMCRATFGSGLNGIDLTSKYLCMIDVTLWRQNGTVSGSADNLHVTPEAGLLMVGSSTPLVAAPAGWFNDGFIHFNTGALAGDAFEIKSWDGTVLTMYLPLPAQPVFGNTFYIEPGCDHTIDSNGCARYTNIVNFQGEPFIPGADSLYTIPDATYNAGNPGGG
jgi:uncharacterized phage protein (TIGR02218 family)